MKADSDNNRTVTIIVIDKRIQNNCRGMPSDKYFGERVSGGDVFWGVRGRGLNFVSIQTVTCLFVDFNRCHIYI